MTLLQEGKQYYVFLMLTLQILLFFNSQNLDLLEKERERGTKKNSKDKKEQNEKTEGS